jgi:hypothetical protein
LTNVKLFLKLDKRFLRFEEAKRQGGFKRQGGKEARRQGGKEAKR